LNSLEPAVFARAKLAVDKIGYDLETMGRADILKWWTLFAMDVISELCFGESFRMLDVGKVGSSGGLFFALSIGYLFDDKQC
jgi:hypothetical protein